MRPPRCTGRADTPSGSKPVINKVMVGAAPVIITSVPSITYNDRNSVSVTVKYWRFMPTRDCLNFGHNPCSLKRPPQSAPNTWSVAPQHGPHHQPRPSRRPADTQPAPRGAPAGDRRSRSVTARRAFIDLTTQPASRAAQHAQSHSATTTPTSTRQVISAVGAVDVLTAYTDRNTVS
jgi:hypothetical protein